MPEPLARLVEAIGVNAVVAVAASAAGTVDRGGAVAGILLGSIVYAALGVRGYALLLAFFVLGSAATKIGYRRKRQAGIAQEKGGRRGWPHAVANAGVPALCAAGAAGLPARDLFLAGFVGALATAAGDTTSSEIGKAFGRRTFSMTTFRAVPAGTTGAVSAEGTAAGIAAAFALSGLGAAAGLVPAAAALWIGLAASVAFLAEGLLGASLETRGVLTNEHVNFLDTLFGALLAMGLFGAAGRWGGA